MNNVVEQVSLFVPDTWSGKTCQERSVPTAERTSVQSSKKRPKSLSRMPLFLDLRKESGQTAEPSWETGGALLGEYMMHSFGECPSVAVVSRLSAILEDNPPQKYSLSAKACQGILNRAERRGKKLPEELERALTAVAIRGEQQPVVAFTQNQRNEVRDLGDVAGALRAQEHGHQPILFEPRSQDGVPRIHGDVSPTLNTAQGGQRQPCVVDTYQAVTGALTPGAHPGSYNGQDAYNDMLIAMASTVAHAEITTDGVSPSLLARAGTGGNNMPNITRGSTVRRLTPLECERLQGYPDGWTDIGEWVDSKGKRHKDADSPRYKALGNSIALPFWFWLLRRISAQYIGPATLGSLFDGIGGFPLCWERCNGKGTALWASEIEEFPMAVARRHFGEENDHE